MAHMLEEKNGRYSFAFTGDRSNIWHRLGQELPPNATDMEWIEAAGLDFTVSKVMALAHLDGPAFDHIDPSERFQPTEQRFIVREDNGHILGFASKGYEIVQPRAVYDWFSDYITADDRFHIDAAGVLQSGERLWVTARFNGDLEIAGDNHVARLLMSTSFDSSQATVNQATTTRTVCNNTLRIAHSDKRAAIRTPHSTKFNGDAVAKELAQIAQSFQTYKAMGDAMAETAMSLGEVSNFFREILEIPLDAKQADISTRKINMHADLSRAYTKTKLERNTNQNDVWTALQAVTRYVDHDRSVRNAGDGKLDEQVARFDSANWGSGDALKGKAMQCLLPLVRDKVLLPA